MQARSSYVSAFSRLLTIHPFKVVCHIKHCHIILVQCIDDTKHFILSVINFYCFIILLFIVYSKQESQQIQKSNWNFACMVFMSQLISYQCLCIVEVFCKQLNVSCPIHANVISHNFFSCFWKKCCIIRRKFLSIFMHKF